MDSRKRARVPPGLGPIALADGTLGHGGPVGHQAASWAKQQPWERAEQESRLTAQDPHASGRVPPDLGLRVPPDLGLRMPARLNGR